MIVSNFMGFKKLYEHEMKIAKVMGLEQKPAYTHKGLLQLRAFNWRLRGRNAPLKAIGDLKAYADMIRAKQYLPESLVL